MAKVQSRRSISLNRTVYEAAKHEAAARGLTASHFLEQLIRGATNMPFPETRHQSPETAVRAVAHRKTTPARSAPVPKKARGGQASTDIAAIRAQVAVLFPYRRYGFERAEQRERDISRALAAELRRRGILTREGCASPDSWSAK